MMVSRAFQTKQWWLLPSLAREMVRMEFAAADQLRLLAGDLDHETDFSTNGIASWKYYQLARRSFVTNAKVVISE